MDLELVHRASLATGSSPLLNGKTVSVLGKLDMPHTYTYVTDFGKGLVLLARMTKRLVKAGIFPTHRR